MVCPAPATPRHSESRPGTGGARAAAWLGAVAAALALAACSERTRAVADCTDRDQDGYGEGPGCLGTDCDDADATCHEGACCHPVLGFLDLHFLDLWAQPVPQGDATVRVTFDGQPVVFQGWPVGRIPLREKGTFQIEYSAPEHHPIQATIAFDGTAGLDAASFTKTAAMAGQGLSFSHDLRSVEGSRLAVHSLYLGLRHKWFSAEARPARRGNRVRLLMDGEEAWSAVYQDLQTARDSVLIANWWWASDFELVRDPATHIGLSQAERWKNTMLGVLDSLPAAKRVLVGEFWGSHDILDWITSDAAIRQRAETPGDGFEFLGQGNPTDGSFAFAIPSFEFGKRVRQAFPEAAGRAFDAEEPIASTVPGHDVSLDWYLGIDFQIASYHQKMVVVDQRVAHVSGMNVKSTDWDTSQHSYYDYRRMEFGATADQRRKVEAKEADPDLGPRKDYSVRIDGPAVQDVADVFRERWSYLIDQKARYSENASRFEVLRDQPAHDDGIPAQVTTSLPQPFWEHGVAESWFNAVDQAERYIFIEDQYWRVPMLVDRLIRRMEQVPGLRLVVFTMPVNEWTDPGCYWTYRTSQMLQQRFPDRYRTYQLRSFDWILDTWMIDEFDARFADIFLHSKMLIVDDKFISVGSCNKNNRGLVYEGEMNLAVLDPSWVREQRRRILANLLPAGTPATDDVAGWWKQLADAAAWNDAVHQAWSDEGFDLDVGDLTAPPAGYLPAGFVYTLTLRDPGDCALEGLGPDLSFR